MTESDWMTCNDAAAMLEALRDRTGDRKMRLFACACARDIWSQLSDADSRRAVEVAERFADGSASLEQLRDAGNLAYDVAWSRGFSGDDARADYVAEGTAREFSVHAAYQAIQHRLGSQLLGDIVREIFGNPFRSVVIDPTWLDYEGARVRRLAQAIYDARAFEQAPELARALAAAGCVDETLLTHLGLGQAHYRGCWALDAVLGNSWGKNVVTEEEWFACVEPRKLVHGYYGFVS
jgi:hypothetical protein